MKYSILLHITRPTNLTIFISGSDSTSPTPTLRPLTPLPSDFLEDECLPLPGIYPPLTYPSPQPRPRPLPW